MPLAGLRGCRWLSGLVVLSLVTGVTAQPLEGAAVASTQESQAELADDPGLLFQAAQRAYSAEQYQEALDILVRIYALDGSPQLLYNIAQAQRQLGQCASARESYLKFLREERDPEYRALALVGLERLRECEQQSGAPAELDGTKLPAEAKGAPEAEVPSASAVAKQVGTTSAQPLLAAGTQVNHSDKDGVPLWLPWGVTGVLVVATVASAVVANNIRIENRTAVRKGLLSDDQVRDMEKHGERWGLAVDILGGAALALGGLSLYWTLSADSTPGAQARPMQFHVQGTF